MEPTATTPVLDATLRDLLLRGADPDDAVALAARVAEACMRLSRHVARLVGDLGVQTLFDRSVHLAAASQPIFAKRETREVTFAEVRACLERADARTVLAAGETLLITFIELLERFIGRALVASLLREVWPESFRPGEVKEPT